MKTISFKTVSEMLSEKELKNVLGGSSGYAHLKCYNVAGEGCEVDHCPDNRSEAEAMCLSCWGSFGEVISCASF